MKRRKFFHPPSASLNVAVNRNFKTINNLMGDWDSPLILNVGSGDRFSGSEELDSCYLDRIVNLDIALMDSIDVLGNAHHLPFCSRTFECVIAQGVLEHIRNPMKAVKEAIRVLKLDGILYAEVPFLQGFHPSPTDYQRYTRQGLLELFSDLECLDIGVCVGPSSALSWILRQYLAGVLTAFTARGWVRSVALTVAGWLTFPIKYLDWLFATRPYAALIASGFYYLGRNGNR